MIACRPWPSRPVAGDEHGAWRDARVVRRGVVVDEDDQAADDRRGRRGDPSRAPAAGRLSATHPSASHPTTSRSARAAARIHPSDGEGAVRRRDVPSAPRARSASTTADSGTGGNSARFDGGETATSSRRPCGPARSAGWRTASRPWAVPSTPQMTSPGPLKDGRVRGAGSDGQAGHVAREVRRRSARVASVASRAGLRSNTEPRRRG